MTINKAEIIDIISRTAYEANRAFCDIIGYAQFDSWDNISVEEKNSVILGVGNCLEKNDITTEENHNKYVHKRIKEGWQYGFRYDEDKKISNLTVEFDKLPKEQQIVDKLFPIIVRTIASLFQNELKIGDKNDNL